MNYGVLGKTGQDYERLASGNISNEEFSPDDFAASFYYNLGIDHTREYHISTGRPITIVRNGAVIHDLFVA